MLSVQLLVAALNLAPLRSMGNSAARASRPSATVAAGVDVLAGARAAASSCPFDAAALTYLEFNGWVLTLGGTTLLLDPILEGPLDFGLPAALYSASKKVLPERGLADALPAFDAIVITQGLSDHAHVPTLRLLAARGLSCPVIAPPSAAAALEAAGVPRSIVQLTSPGQKRTVGGVEVVATSGALVGPPWQARENGYVFRTAPGRQTTFPAVYVEPHAEFNAEELRKLAPVDVVITPVVGQSLPAFELVHDSRSSLALVQALRPTTVVPMGNGEINAVGITAKLVWPVGTLAEFETKLGQSGLGAELARVEPGVPVWIGVGK